MPRTKKTPTSQSLVADATSRPMESPKGSGPSVAPTSSPSLPVDVFHVRMVRRGRATRARSGFRVATIPVHVPTGRVVYQVVRPGTLRLGPHVDDFRALGYIVTTLENIPV